MDDPNKIIVITGTRKGLGRFIAEHYAGNGWLVYGCSRSAADWSHPNYHHVQLDVSDEPAVLDFFSDMKRQKQSLVALINNAGVAHLNHSLLTPISQCHKIFATNFTGTFLFSREAAKLMTRERSGRIINIGSIAVPLNIPGEALYASSKAAVTTLTKIMAKELASFNVTVNTIAPGPMRTDMLKGVPKNVLQRVLEMHAMQEFSTFEDVVNVLDFLIKPASRMITGQIIYLGGA